MKSRSTSALSPTRRASRRTPDCPSAAPEAPILWPGADGSFSFQFWQLDPLDVGGSEDVRVFLGHQGLGKNTFCAVPDTFLPKDVPVIATLIYRDKEGKE